MNYEQFLERIKSIDHKPVILLEGKREVLIKDQHLLFDLGEKLAKDLPNCIFRSGNATGADELFMNGAAMISPERLEFILPYNSHRKQSKIPDSKYYSIEDMVISSEVFSAILDATPFYKNIMKAYASSEKNKLVAKAWYLIRDTIKVFGYNNELQKADLAIFYDDLKRPESGGTGHTIRVCKKQKVSVFDQKIWMKWMN